MTLIILEFIIANYGLASNIGVVGIEPTIEDSKSSDLPLVDTPLISGAMKKILQIAKLIAIYCPILSESELLFANLDFSFSTSSFSKLLASIIALADLMSE